MSAAPEPLPVVFVDGPGLAYEAHAPPPALAPWVHAVWRVRASRRGDLRVLPDGCVDLIGGDVVGPFTAAALFRVEPGYEARGVRLRPGAFPALFGVPASELLDEELVGRGPASLAAQAADAAPPDPLAEAAMRAVGAGSLSRESGYSPRHLRRRVLAAAGLSPARMARIGRMQRALSAGRGESWARTAVEHGWYDEAHMANDVSATWPGRRPTRCFAASSGRPWGEPGGAARLVPRAGRRRGDLPLQREHVRLQGRGQDVRPVGAVGRAPAGEREVRPRLRRGAAGGARGDHPRLPPK